MTQFPSLPPVSDYSHSTESFHNKQLSVGFIDRQNNYFSARQKKTNDVYVVSVSRRDYFHIKKENSLSQYAVLWPEQKASYDRRPILQYKMAKTVFGFNLSEGLTSMGMVLVCLREDMDSMNWKVVWPQEIEPTVHYTHLPLNQQLYPGHVYVGMGQDMSIQYSVYPVTFGLQLRHLSDNVSEMSFY